MNTRKTMHRAINIAVICGFVLSFGGVEFSHEHGEGFESVGQRGLSYVILDESVCEADHSSTDDASGVALVSHAKTLINIPACPVCSRSNGRYSPDLSELQVSYSSYGKLTSSDSQFVPDNNRIICYNLRAPPA